MDLNPSLLSETYRSSGGLTIRSKDFKLQGSDKSDIEFSPKRDVEDG